MTLGHVQTRVLLEKFVKRYRFGCKVEVRRKSFYASSLPFLGHCRFLSIKKRPISIPSLCCLGCWPVSVCDRLRELPRASRCLALTLLSCVLMPHGPSPIFLHGLKTQFFTFQCPQVCPAFPATWLASLTPPWRGSLSLPHTFGGPFRSSPSHPLLPVRYSPTSLYKIKRQTNLEELWWLRLAISSSNISFMTSKTSSNVSASVILASNLSSSSPGSLYFS